MAQRWGVLLLPLMRAHEAASRAELEGHLREAGFTDVRVAVNQESGSFIKDWEPGSGAEDYEFLHGVLLGWSGWVKRAWPPPARVAMPPPQQPNEQHRVNTATTIVIMVPVFLSIRSLL